MKFHATLNIYIPALEPQNYRFQPTGVADTINGLLIGALFPRDRSHHNQASAVPDNMRALYESATLPDSELGISRMEQYLKGFAHPALHHLVQMMGIHHQEILGQFTLSQELHSYLLDFYNLASSFIRENCEAILENRAQLISIQNKLSQLDVGVASLLHEEVATGFTETTTINESWLQQATTNLTSQLNAFTKTTFEQIIQI